MKNGQALAWIWRVSGREKAKVAAMTLVQAILGGSSVLSAWILRGLIDYAVGSDPAGFRYYGVLFIGVTAAQLALRALFRHLSESCRSALENRFKHRLFGAILSADHASVNAVHSGEWMNRLTSDTVVIANGLTDILPGVSGMLVKLLAALGLLVFLLPDLYLLILLGGSALVLLTWVFRKTLKALHKEVQETDGDLRAFLTERLGAMMVIRAFGKQDATQGYAKDKMTTHRAARMKKNRFSNICNIGFGLAIQGGYVIGALVCSYGILQGTMSYGTFTAVLQLISQIQAPFANISGFLPRFYAMLASAERLMEVENAQPDCPEGNLTEAEARAFYNILERIELKDVTFFYPDDTIPALSGLNLSIRKGNYVAFTGASGCGKSTVLKLLLALYQPESGTQKLVTRDGSHPLTARYRNMFAYVPQGNVLMSGTIRQVLTFGDDTIPEEALWNALEIACADEFVRQLELGLETQLSERGSGLSEGQMQRLAIARAVLSDKPILLLDEATSALDEATEAAVLEKMRAMTDKTVVIVTHRPAALAICDLEVPFG